MEPKYYNQRIDCTVSNCAYYDNKEQKCTLGKITVSDNDNAFCTNYEKNELE